MNLQATDKQEGKIYQSIIGAISCEKPPFQDEKWFSTLGWRVSDIFNCPKENVHMIVRINPE